MGSGFPDWQRVGPYDGPDLLNIAVALAAGSTIFGPFSVSRWARVGGFFSAPAGKVWIQVQWSDQADGLNVIAERAFGLDSNTGLKMDIQLPNLGPYMRIRATALTVNPSFSAVLFGNNRQQAMEVVPNTPLLFDLQAQSVLGGGTNTYATSSFFSGRARLWFEPQGGGPWIVNLNLMNSAGNYDLVWQRGGVAASTDLDVDIPVALGQLQLKVINQGATANFYLTLTPLASGA